MGRYPTSGSETRPRIGREFAAVDLDQFEGRDGDGERVRGWRVVLAGLQPESAIFHTGQRHCADRVEGMGQCGVPPAAR